MGRFLVQEYAAHGGPPTPALGQDVFETGPTDPGVYLVAYCGRHQSKRYPDWSRVPWGTPLKEELGELWVKMDGKWQKLSKFSRVRKEHVEAQHKLWYGTAKVPDTWVFNDFGHKTCFLFKDLNKNRKLDGKEKIHGEFLHTTPQDEANTALGIRFTLAESHGCVHLKPLDIDDMETKGYLRRGTSVIVHKYTEKTHGFRRSNQKPGRPYELHFFPALFRIFVTGDASF